MNEQFRCGDTTALVSYVYEECSPDESRAIAAHLLVCGICADDIETLSATRTQLRSWTPPEARLDFRIVSNADGAGNVLRPLRWWQRPMPAWAQAAAAALVFGLGLSLGAARGWMMSGAPSMASSPAAAPTGAASPVSSSDLASLEERLRAEIRQLHTAPVAASAPAGGDAQLLARVRALIQESEDRQQRELTLRAAEIIRDVDVQRRGDLAQIERTFGQMEGTTGVQVEQQRQMLNYLMRVSQTGQ